MKLNFILILVFSLSNLQTNGQLLADKWANTLSNSEGFQEIDNSRFANWDFSEILSNQSRFEGDPISTYVGVFGSKFRRIDFHLEASKNEGLYEVIGKSKLGNNIQSLSGKIELVKILLRRQEYITDSLYIGIFNYDLREPGIKDGDGCFSGTLALVFYKKDNNPQLFNTSSGDEPSFTNTFVGTWKRYNSEVERSVIFSFHAAGLYEGLPYCEGLYTFDENDDYKIIKDEYVNYGWENYNYKGKKSDWWK